MTSSASSFWKPFLIAFALAMAVGGLGALTTDLGTWYQTLNKPSWQPPDWLFGPVWTTIFGLAALSAVFAWRKAPEKSSREIIVILFAANAFLNVLWSLLFFRLKRPDWALLEVALLWLSVLVPLVVLSRYSAKSGWLLVPYLAWVSFAGVLNYMIVQLNPVA